PQNRIGRRHMKEKLRQAIAEKIRLGIESALFRRPWAGNDLAGLLTIYARRVDSIDEGHGLADEISQLLEAAIGVIVLGYFKTGQACRYATGKVASNLNLAGQGKHIRKQARLK